MIRTLLITAGIICTVVFCSVNYERTITGDSDESDLRIGFQPSPWMIVTTVADDTGNTTNTSFKLFSLSAVFGIAGALSFIGAAKFRMNRG